MASGFFFKDLSTFIFANLCEYIWSVNSKKWICTNKRNVHVKFDSAGLPF